MTPILVSHTLPQNKMVIEFNLMISEVKKEAIIKEQLQKLGFPEDTEAEYRPAKLIVKKPYIRQSKE